MNLFIRILIQSLAVFIAAYILPGVHVDSLITVLVVAIVLGIVNILLKPLLIFLTLPITILTLGLFILIINAFLVLIVDMLVPGFYVNGFLWAILFSLVVSVTSSVLNGVSK